MGKGVRPDYRLVRLDRGSRYRGDEAARRVYLLADDPCIDGEQILAGSQNHHDLFERRVAGAFAYAVDRAFHLARPVSHRSNRVRNRQAQVVVTVNADDGPGDIRDVLHHVADQCTEFVRYRVTHRIGYVYRACPRFDRNCENPAQIVPVQLRVASMAENSTFDV